MGALHQGHGDLMRASRAVDDVTVLSVFVNPTQFDDSTDFDLYPRTLEPDVEMARDLGIQAVFAPAPPAMYPPGHDTRVSVGTLAGSMEGIHRPGHFDGVATVVTKLLHIVEPSRAWFGAKDWQQVAVVRRVITDLNIPVEIRAVPTRRETDGLAMSSRNARLDGPAREAATCLWRGLSAARDAHSRGVTGAGELCDLVARAVAPTEGCRLEYVSVVHPDTLAELADSGAGAVVCAAMWCDGVRLIDNVELPASP